MIETALLVITLGSFVAAFVNAAFATGGVYIMLLASASVLPLAFAIPLQSAFTAGSLIARIFYFWRDIDWHIVRLFVLGSFFGVYLGASAFIALPDQTLSILLGFVLLSLIWIPKLNWQLPIRHVFLFVGVIHSYLGALLGIGGVLQPVVLRTNLTKLQITGTLAACLLALDIMKAASYISFGFNYLDFIPLMAGATAAGFLGTWAGKCVTHHVSEHTFRKVFRILVSLIAVRHIYKGWTA